MLTYDTTVCPGIRWHAALQPGQGGFSRLQMRMTWLYIQKVTGEALPDSSLPATLNSLHHCCIYSTESSLYDPRPLYEPVDSCNLHMVLVMRDALDSQ